jgi:hypothetical protein
MAIYIPPMQQSNVNYTFGQTTASSLLDAIRIRNQNEMQLRALDAQKRMQDARIRSSEGMQDKDISSRETISAKQLANRYNIAKEGRKTQKQIADNANQLAKDLLSTRLDWQTLDRDAKITANKLAQEAGFTNAENMLRMKLDAESTNLDKRLGVQRDALGFDMKKFNQIRDDQLRTNELVRQQQAVNESVEAQKQIGLDIERDQRSFAKNLPSMSWGAAARKAIEPLGYDYDTYAREQFQNQTGINLGAPIQPAPLVGGMTDPIPLNYQNPVPMNANNPNAGQNILFNAMLNQEGIF